MKDLDIDKLMDLADKMDKPETGNNLDKVLAFMNNLDVVLDQIEQFMGRMDRLGLKPLIVRGIGMQLGIDAESPLQTENSTYKSETHKKVIEGLNTLTEEQLMKNIDEMSKNVQAPSD